MILLGSGGLLAYAIVRPKSGGNGCTYDLAERYRLMQSICQTLCKGRQNNPNRQIIKDKIQKFNGYKCEHKIRQLYSQL